MINFKRKIWINILNVIVEKIALPKKNFIVALSGGADSLCLTMLASEFAKNNNLEMTAVFVNHKLREESSDEILPVLNILNKRNIAYKVLVWEHDNTLITGNLEKKAREARYKLLIDFCKTITVTTILTAHHALDQWETFFMRLSRGSGLTGLSCIKKNSIYKGFEIIRPLLNYTKDDIIETLNKKFDITEFVMDPMNNDEAYERVRWRKEYNGLNEKYNLGVKNITKTIERLQKAEDYLELATDIEYKKIFDGEYIKLKEFKELHQEIQYRIIKKIINSSSIVSYSLLEKTVEKICSPTFKATNIGKYVFRKDRSKNIKVYKESRKLSNLFHSR